ncbi:hypothetical protein [Escherichia coli]|uniref:hypothetical protein n=1 Tax=Escherichia coli TaxID=562 RepID=UPI002103506D|nr:hypothetical protein [Escherichia coli]MCQ1961897.1 hypothetical protein [Escherichia coli]MCQ1970833.1 hypothetical protein [Escherichia coli]
MAMLGVDQKTAQGYVKTKQGLEIAAASMTPLFGQAVANKITALVYKANKYPSGFVELFNSPSVLLPVFYNSFTWSRFGCISVFFKNEVFLFPINQIKSAVYFGVITGLTAWVLRTVLSTVRFKISEEITFAIILKNIICDICFR